MYKDYFGFLRVSNIRKGFITMKKRLQVTFTIVLAIVLTLAGYGIGSSKGINVTLSYENGGASGSSAVTTSTTVATTVATTAPTTAPTQATTEATTVATTAAADPATTDAVATTAASTDAATPTESTTAASTEDQAASSALPSTKEEILKKYTDVLNQCKQQDKPSYRKTEYQEMPEEHRNFSGAANAVLNVASGMMTSKEDGEKNAAQHEKGDMGSIPVTKTDYGCLLTDANAIKDAKCVDNGDGTATLTIVLNDESNATPVESGATSSASAHGGVFAPMSQDGINDIIGKVPGLKVNSLELKYTDCTTTLTYNTADNHVVKLDQLMNVDIIADAKVVVAPLNGSARISAYCTIDNFGY